MEGLAFEQPPRKKNIGEKKRSTGAYRRAVVSDETHTLFTLPCLPVFEAPYLSPRKNQSFSKDSNFHSHQPSRAQILGSLQSRWLEFYWHRQG